MRIKLLEVRDTATFVPAAALELSAMTEQEQFLARRAGFCVGDVVVYRLDRYQPASYGWWEQVCNHIAKEFDRLESGMVLDMRYVRGEVSEPCESDRVA